MNNAYHLGYCCGMFKTAAPLQMWPSSAPAATPISRGRKKVQPTRKGSAGGAPKRKPSKGSPSKTPSGKGGKGGTAIRPYRGPRLPSLRGGALAGLGRGISSLMLMLGPGYRGKLINALSSKTLTRPERLTQAYSNLGAGALGLGIGTGAYLSAQDKKPPANINIGAGYLPSSWPPPQAYPYQ
jgi:hypothetical protein